MNFSEKQIKLLEIYFKALSNKKRIKILILIKKIPDLNVEKIADKIKIQYQTAASHIQKLEKAGFIYKRYSNLEVLHTITPRGEKVLSFFEKLLNEKN